MLKGKKCRTEKCQGRYLCIKSYIDTISTLIIALALAVLAAWPATVFAQIQLDGDAKKSTGTGSGTDWDEVLCPNASINCTGLTAGGGATAKTGLVVDRPEPSFAQFTGGGSKDEQDIPIGGIVAGRRSD